MSRKSHEERYLFIPDLQIPFEHKGALDFCKEIKKTFRIPNENCYCVGDETDQFYGGGYVKTPDATHSAISEIEEVRYKIRKWGKVFPELKIAVSNHGTRYWRKALEAQIPSQMLRRYEEVIEAPKGWKWKKRWEIKAPRQKMIMEHGDDWGTQFPHRVASIHNGVSTIMGHHHATAGTTFIKTAGLDVWGMCTGSLIDFEAYAFEYAKRYKFKPVSGIGIVLDSGKTPVFIPYE